MRDLLEMISPKRVGPFIKSSLVKAFGFYRVGKKSGLLMGLGHINSPDSMSSVVS